MGYRRFEPGLFVIETFLCGSYLRRLDNAALKRFHEGDRSCQFVEDPEYFGLRYKRCRVIDFGWFIALTGQADLNTLRPGVEDISS